MLKKKHAREYALMVFKASVKGLVDVKISWSASSSRYSPNYRYGYVVEGNFEDRSRGRLVVVRSDDPFPEMLYVSYAPDDSIEDPDDSVEDDSIADENCLWMHVVEQLWGQEHDGYRIGFLQATGKDEDEFVLHYIIDGFKSKDVDSLRIELDLLGKDRQGEVD